MEFLTRKNNGHLFRGGGPFQQIPPSIPMYNIVDLQEGINKDLQRGYNIGQAVQKGIIPKEKDAEYRILARGLSAIGTGLQWVPHPITRVVGAALTIPDTYYDTKDFIQDPTVENGTSLLLDIPAKIPNVPGYVDDIMRGVSIADDVTGVPSWAVGKTVKNAGKFFNRTTKDSIFMRPLTYKK